MSDLKLYDVMAEDMTVFAEKKKNNHVEVEIHNELGEVVFFIEAHQYAWDSLVDFARQVVWIDDRMKIIEELDE